VECALLGARGVSFRLRCAEPGPSRAPASGQRDEAEADEQVLVVARIIRPRLRGVEDCRARVRCALVGRADRHARKFVADEFGAVDGPSKSMVVAVAACAATKTNATAVKETTSNVRRW
jgi:hypothetical protein